VELWDERLSLVAAHEILEEAGMRKDFLTVHHPSLLK